MKRYPAKHGHKSAHTFNNNVARVKAPNMSLNPMRGGYRF